MKIKRMLVLLLVLVMLVGLLPVLAAAETLEDGYYLIGPDWSVDAIRPADCFTINPANSEEYMLNTTLSEGQLEYLKETAAIKKTIDFLKENAKITEKPAEKE